MRYGEGCRTGLAPPGKEPAKFFPGLTCESEATGPGAVRTCRLTLTLQGTRCFSTQQGVSKMFPRGHGGGCDGQGLASRKSYRDSRRVFSPAQGAPTTPLQGLSLTPELRNTKPKATCSLGLKGGKFCGRRCCSEETRGFPEHGTEAWLV